MLCRRDHEGNFEIHTVLYKDGKMLTMQSTMKIYGKTTEIYYEISGKYDKIIGMTYI